MEVLADKERNVTQKLKSVPKRVENIVGKGENVYYRLLFLLSRSAFNSPLLLGSLTLYSIDTHFNTSTTDCF